MKSSLVGVHIIQHHVINKPPACVFVASVLHHINLWEEVIKKEGG